MKELDTLGNSNYNTTIFYENMGIGDVLLTVISLFVIISGIFSLLFILYGGLLLVISGGNEEKIKKSVKTIKYAIYGLIVTISVIFLFPILGNLLGIDVTVYANPILIIDRIEGLSNVIFK